MTESVFKIATYNVNSIRSRLHIILPWLEKHSPHVLCMQETKVEDDKFPVSVFRERGYHVHFRGRKQYNGVAVASLREPDDVRCGFDDAGSPDDDRLLYARFGDLSVLNTYVPQGRDKDSEHFTYKLNWFARLERLIRETWNPGDRLIWCGDLNVAPEAIDVYDPKRLLGHVCFNPELWSAYEGVCAWGLKDVFRCHHPGEEKQYTFYDYRVARNALLREMGWRIDHILATDPLCRLSRSCAIDLEPRRAEKPSDHTVLYAEFYEK